MDIMQIIQQKMSQLPPHQQQEVLDFAEFLARKNLSQKSSSQSAVGYLAHLNVHITQEDIAEIRREM